MNKNKFEYCPNPKCGTEGGGSFTEDTRTKLTPQNVLYKCEASGRMAHYLYAPKRFSKKWCKKVRSPLPGCSHDKIDVNRVYCPKCHAALNLDRDIVRVALAGPTNCGKTVYLTVLNELLLRREEFDRLSFTRDKVTNAFSFERIPIEKDGVSTTGYVLPDGTQTEAIPYMQYQVYGNPDPAILRGGKKNDVKFRLLNDSLDLLLYDVAGEWFGESKKQDKNRNIKIAHLFNADLILFMIDCEQIIDDDERIGQKKQGLGRERYLQALESTIRELDAKNKKNYHIAFCFLAIDILQAAEVEKYKKLIASYLNSSSSYNFYEDDKVCFDRDRYLESEGKILKAFKPFYDVIMKQNRDHHLDLNRMGVFAISSLGHDGMGNIEKAEEESMSGDKIERKYLATFNPINCWGVTDPFLWFLASKGYIRTKETKSK